MGKSHFIRYLQSSGGKAFMRQLGLSVNAKSTIMSARDFEVHPHSLTDVVLHYDIARPWKRGFAFEYKKDALLNRLSQFHSVTIMTIWIPREVLVNRHVQRRRTFVGWLKAYTARALLRRDRLRCRSVSGLYDDPAEHLRMYSCWFSFCRNIAADCHWMLDYSDTDADPIPHPVVSL